MIDVYADEAGDLGFGGRATKYFAVGYIMSRSSNQVSTNVRRFLKNTNRHSNRKLVEFKFRLDSDTIRCRFLNKVCEQDFCGGQIIVNKKAVQPHLKGKPVVLYNYLIVDTIWKAVISEYGSSLEHVNLYLDRSLTRSRREEFDAYSLSKLEWLCSVSNMENNITSTVFHVDSHNEPCIQVVDYLASSLFRAYEYNDSKYYEMVRTRIKYSMSWLN